MVVNKGDERWGSRCGGGGIRGEVWWGLVRNCSRWNEEGGFGRNGDEDVRRFKG